MKQKQNLLHKRCFLHFKNNYSFFYDETKIPREALAVDSSQEFHLESNNGNEESVSDGETQTQCTDIKKPKQVAFLLLIQVWINALSNGVIPSIQPFACIPYGNNVYYYTLILSNVANPCSSLLFHWVPTTKVLFIGLLSMVYSSFVTYIVCIASLSSDPPLTENNIGAIIIVSVQRKFS